MTHFVTTAAVAAFVALSTVAAGAADLRTDVASRGFDSVRAGDVYSARELATARLNESDIVEFTARPQIQVRAGDVYSAHDLASAGLDANAVLTVSDFSGNGQTNVTVNDWRADR